MLDGSFRVHGCIEYNPKSSSVMFGGEFISLTQLNKETGISLAMLSKIFKGERSPSLKSAEKMAAAFKVALGKFVAALRQHQDSMPYQPPRPYNRKPVQPATT